MIKNHTHDNDSGSIHYIFTIIPLFFKSYAFPYKLCNVLVYDIVIFYFLFNPFKI